MGNGSCGKCKSMLEEKPCRVRIADHKPARPSGPQCGPYCPVYSNLSCGPRIADGLLWGWTPEGAVAMDGSRKAAVHLSDDQRQRLEEITHNGSSTAKRILHAQV